MQLINYLIHSEAHLSPKRDLRFLPSVFYLNMQEELKVGSKELCQDLVICVAYSKDLERGVHGTPTSTLSLIIPPEGRGTALFLAAMLSIAWTYSPKSVTYVFFRTKSQYWLKPFSFESGPPLCEGN